MGVGSHLCWVRNRNRDFGAVQSLDQGTLIPTSGFADHVYMRHTLQFSAKLSQSPRLIGEFGLMPLQFELEGGFGYVDSSIDSMVLGLHIFDRGLTHPYLYELAVVAAALATVRVWSTGCAQL